VNLKKTSISGNLGNKHSGKARFLMPNDQQIEEVAALLFGASLAFTNTIGRKGWAWDACDERTKQYWRQIARYAWNVFNRPTATSDTN